MLTVQKLSIASIHIDKGRSSKKNVPWKKNIYQLLANVYSGGEKLQSGALHISLNMLVELCILLGNHIFLKL